mmetsp:Transcript_29938/g.64545  ORF Transcript_29938/g.64545 Transcript_29938/m.64545 type:complete len:231 (-) Transcript_29938:84-776(-)
MWTLLRAWFALVVCIAEELAEVALDSDLDAECQPSDPSNPSNDASTSCGTLSLAQLRAKALAKDTRGSQTLENCEMSDRMQIRWTADPTLCLSSEGNRIGNGIRMQLWKCDETWSSPGQIFKQQLLRWAADERIRMAFNPEYCVVVDNDDFKNGAKIQLWKCDDSNEMQDWVLWSHFGGSCSGMIAAQATDKEYCMVVDGNNGFDGAKVQLWKCAGDQYAKTWSPWTQEA